jgi:hypothetical protein
VQSTQARPSPKRGPTIGPTTASWKNPSMCGSRGRFLPR